MKKDTIPENETGKEVDLFEELEFHSIEEARSAFSIARQKLLHPETWKPSTGKLAADFRISDTVEEDSGKQLAAGDFISIDIPGPGLAAGHGHDWVKVESIDENAQPGADESVALTVMVCENPEEPGKGVAHFFAEGASSTFVIKRKRQILTASYHGRNEMPNTDNPGLGDKIRNVLVALGAMAGASELHWKAFLKGLIGKE